MSDLIVDLQFVIPEALVKMNAVEAFAKDVGWKTQVKSSADDGSVTYIDNPVSSLDYSKTWIKKFVANRFIAISKRAAGEQAAQQVIALLPDDVK